MAITHVLTEQALLGIIIYVFRVKNTKISTN
jgi:hypothetical protein